MSYHRRHIERLLDLEETPEEERTNIFMRTEEAVREFGGMDEGCFCRSKLEQVLGDPALVQRFHELWAADQLTA